MSFEAAGLSSGLLLVKYCKHSYTGNTQTFAGLFSADRLIYDLIANIDFSPKKSYSKHQQKLLNDVGKITRSKNVLICTDKTHNLYMVSPEFYNKMLLENVT